MLLLLTIDLINSWKTNGMKCICKGHAKGYVSTPYLRDNWAPSCLGYFSVRLQVLKHVVLCMHDNDVNDKLLNGGR